MIVQVVEGYVHWLTQYVSLDDVPDMEPSYKEQFKEAPDNVHENWFYNYDTGEFSAPPIPTGWAYDANGVPYAVDVAIIAAIQAQEATFATNAKQQRIDTNKDIIQEAVDAYTLQLIEEGLL
jgi:hypothetical protein